MQKFSLDFKDRSVQSLYTLGDNRFVQASFMPGQGFTKNVTKQMLSVVVLTGRIKFTAGNETIELLPSELVIVEPATEHSIEAVEQSTLLLTMIARSEKTGEQTAKSPDDGGALRHTTAYDDPQLLDRIAPELKCFVEDHIEVCEVLVAAKNEFNVNQYKETLQVIGDELNRHFVYEEEILFPRLNRVLGGADVGPVPRLLQEHEKIRSVYGSVADLVERFSVSSSSQEPLETQMNNLIELLWNHCGKEDTHLFPMAGRLLSVEDKKAIEAEVRERDKARV